MNPHPALRRRVHHESQAMQNFGTQGATRLAAGFALGAALLALGFAVGIKANQARMGNDIAAMKASIASLELAASNPRPPSVPASARAWRHREAAMRATQPPFAGESFPSPEEAQLNLAIEKQQLDAAFESESLDPGWSGEATSLVQDALVNVAAQPGFPIPSQSRIDCRSRSCRVALSLSDSGEAGQISDSLLADISSLLPQAKLVEVPSADGLGLDLYIYATTLPAR